MAIQPMALAVQNTQGNALGAFAQGQQHAQQTRANDLAMAQQTMQNIGSLAFGVLGGKLDGQADPALWEEALDMIGSQGVNVDAFRGRPDMAAIIAKASADTLGQMNHDLNEQQLAQRMHEFDFQVSEALKGPAPTVPSYSQTPVFLTDPDGNQHVGQMSSGGGVLINGQQLPGVPEGWSVVNRPQALGTINDGQQIQAFNPNLGPDAGTVAPIATIQGDPSANMNVTIDPATGDRTMAAAPGSEQAIERNANRSKAESALRALETKTSVVTGAIDKALAGTDWWTTGGMGAILSAAPGTPQFDLAKTLDTIKANIGFEELQTMRDNSPTGGALGGVSEREIQFLQSTIASIEQAQSEEQLRTNLQALKDFFATSKSNRQAAFDSTFAGKPATNAPASAPATDMSLDDLLEKYQ